MTRPTWQSPHPLLLGIKDWGHKNPSCCCCICCCCCCRRCHMVFCLLFVLCFCCCVLLLLLFLFSMLYMVVSIVSTTLFFQFPFFWFQLGRVFGFDSSQGFYLFGEHPSECSLLGLNVFHRLAHKKKLTTKRYKKGPPNYYKWIYP